MASTSAHGVAGSAGTRSASGRRAASLAPAGSGFADPAEQARDICLRLLAVRPRTRAELAAALRRRRIADQVAEEVLDRYGEVGMVDDVAFARAWVTSRHHGRGLARRALAAELRRRGVDSHAARLALGEIDDATEAETARMLVDRALRGHRGGGPHGVLRRLVGMLARKGYQPALAIRVVREALLDRAGTAGFAADIDVEHVGVDAVEVDAVEADAVEAAAEADAVEADAVGAPGQVDAVEAEAGTARTPTRPTGR